MQKITKNKHQIINKYQIPMFKKEKIERRPKYISDNSVLNFCYLLFGPEGFRDV